MPKRHALTGGFAARYGTVTRRRYVAVVSGLRRRHECPKCRFRTVKRRSVGIWSCRKCGYSFAGGAYTPTTKLGEIAKRATRGQMSPSTLSTELDSLRAGARVAPSVSAPAKKPRTRRKKTVEISEDAKAKPETSESPSPEAEPQ